MILATTAAFLQVMAITSHRWFVAGSGAEVGVQAGLRDARFCILTGCETIPLHGAGTGMQSALYFVGWACALLLAAAAIAHKTRDEPGLWKLAGIAHTAALVLLVLVFFGEPTPGGRHSWAFLLSATGIVLALVVAFRNEWSDTAPVVASDEKLPEARLRK